MAKRSANLKDINSSSVLTQDNINILKNITNEDVYVLKQFTRNLRNGVKIPKLTKKQHDRLMGKIGKQKGRFTVYKDSSPDRMSNTLMGAKTRKKRKRKN